MSFLLQPALPGAIPIPLPEDFDKPDFLRQCREQGIEVTEELFRDLTELATDLGADAQQQGLIQLVPKIQGLAIIFYSAQAFHRDHVNADELLADTTTALQCRQIPRLQHDTAIWAQVLLDEESGNTMQACTAVVEHAHPDFFIRADGFTYDTDLTDVLVERFATWVDGLEIQVDND
jgi:hypothetical protein